MLSDPQSVTLVTGSPLSLPKTNVGPTSSQFTYADGSVALVTKQNQTASRFRREVRLTFSKVAVDPISGANKLVGASCYLVIDEPKGRPITATEIKNMVEGLKTWLTSGNQDKILGGEF